MRRKNTKRARIDSHIESSLAFQRSLETHEPGTNERIGELALVLAHVLLNMSNADQRYTVSGHFEYIHQAEEGEDMPPDGPNRINAPTLPKDRRVEDLEFSRAYLLKPDSSFSQIAFVTEDGEHYVFSDSNVIDVKIEQETLLKKFEDIENSLPPEKD